MGYFKESRVFGYGFQEAENGEFQSSFFTPLFYIFAGMLFGFRALVRKEPPKMDQWPQLKRHATGENVFITSLRPCPWILSWKQTRKFRGSNLEGKDNFDPYHRILPTWRAQGS